MEFSETNEYTKAFKRLYKKYKTLDTDIANIKEIICCYPKGAGARHWNLLSSIESCHVYKTRLMCRAVKGSGFRLVYLYDEDADTFVLIEIYYKGDQENETKALYTEILHLYVNDRNTS